MALVFAHRIPGCAFGSIDIFSYRNVTPPCLEVFVFAPFHINHHVTLHKIISCHEDRNQLVSTGAIGSESGMKGQGRSVVYSRAVKVLEVSSQKAPDAWNSGPLHYLLSPCFLNAPEVQTN